ncbi:MAG: MFS transporter, partial [Lachnospiraceae bacterium]|nr:MFS transporter [Lachnospiraceae bacterium]
MKLNYKRTILIGFAFMSLSAFWQMYDNVIPLILVNKDSFGLGDTVTGAIMALDNVLAIFLLPFFGALSDRANTRIGKRMPFILVGTILAVVLLLVLGLADRLVNLPLFIIVLFLLLLAMSLYRSPAVALMPDLTPNHLRSKGNAVINLLGAVGGAFALVMIMLLTPKQPDLPLDDPAYFYHPDYIPLFLSIAVFMAVAVALLFATINEKKLSHRVHEEVAAYEKETGEKLTVNIADDPEEETNLKVIFKGGLFAGLNKDVKRSMIFLLASIFLWF